MIQIVKEIVYPHRILDLLKKAWDRDGNHITVCNGKKSWLESVTEIDGKLYFWYNTPSGTTHVVKEED